LQQDRKVEARNPNHPGSASCTDVSHVLFATQVSYQSMDVNADLTCIFVATFA
jgi:hypothetical protein